MISLFKNTGPKRFNFKPVYYDPIREKKEAAKKINFREKNYSDKMYGKWDRVSFTKMRESGKRQAIILLLITAVLLIIMIYNLENIESLLRKL